MSADCPCEISPCQGPLCDWRLWERGVAFRLMDRALPDILSAYPTAGLLQRIMIRHRPDICPPWRFYEHIPQGASVLDVGCGMGSHLITLAALDRISSGHGVDVSSRAIDQAALAAKSYPRSNLTFEVMRSIDSVPKNKFDVVIMIDVMHHVPKDRRESTFFGCVERVKSGGIFIYKDMADRPSFNAFANRMHDLVIAGEWVRYLPLETALEWGSAAGLQLVRRAEYKKLFYAHELLVFRS